MEEMDWLAERFQEHRAHLVDVGVRQMRTTSIGCSLRIGGGGGGVEAAGYDFGLGIGRGQSAGLVRAWRGRQTAR